ncbi:DJ-1/PfpI family protein [Ammoniphilus resinae]|uniref:Transcriptional regulator GlxA family with amidase domain n=1 Tax=Ammoniphilus resinae TaxID=861532 RepID=A0ABS4GW71_9BACL|nr:DJ-1/PfpI family protein [Ammoniphilus resinae]MBP1934491.1 transcriptional regulator GlxA family with amidase domain [Ammoniphilus resinae]
MKSLFLRLVIYISLVVVFVGGMGWFGFQSSRDAFYQANRKEPLPSLQGIAKPKYDPKKPTVAVLLGNESTYGSDFMIPYEVFSRTGAYNVYAVASDNQVKTLTGGLDVVPHYSFQELDQLLGKSPDIIAIPFMNGNDEEKFQPIRKWIQQHAEATFLSICGGSGNLAATGLLKGKSAASHWLNLGVFEKDYPDTNWISDQRYVEDGNIISSAGVSSGIDASLYVISQKLGEPMAAKIAKELNYPTYHFVQNPKMEPFEFEIATYAMNHAFQWNRKKVGALLYNGVEEIALSSVFDIYSNTGTTTVLSISNREQPIMTKHGLNLVSRHSLSNAPKLDRMIVPGREASELVAKDMKNWNKEVLFIHSDAPERYMLEVEFEDLAKQEDLLTANHAVKRLEFRGDEIHLEGKAFPLETYGNILFAALLGLFVGYLIDRRMITKKNRNLLKP